MSKRVIDQHEQAGTLHDEIPLLRFVNETVFQTKDGSFGLALEVSGIDPDCRLDEDLDGYSRRIEKALKTLDERFRLYQYFIKRFGTPIPSKGGYSSPAATEFVGRRIASLRERAQGLASVSLYFVVLYEGHTAQRWFGLSAASAHRQLTEADTRAVETLTNTVRSFTASLDDMLGFQLLERERAALFFRTLLNPDPLHAVHFHHPQPGEALDYVVADTDPWIERDHLRLGEYYLTAASMKLTPTHPKPAAIASALAQVNCDFIVCLEWKPQSTMHMRKLIKARQKTFVAQGISMMTAAFAGAWTPKSEMPQKQDLEHHAENLGDCLVALEKGAQFGAFSCVIVLLGTDYVRVRNSFSELVGVYGQSDASLVKESLNLFSAWLSIVPGNTQRNHSYAYLLDYDFANLTFAWQAYTGNRWNQHLRDEYLCLYETTDQQVFYFNGHVGGTFGILKTGAPESGKSFDTVYQIAHLQKYDPLTLILDIGGSYRDVTEYFGGQYFEISQRVRSGTSLNPFSLENTPENKQFLFYFLRLLVGRDANQTQQEAAKEDLALHSAVESLYELDPHLRRLKYVSLPAGLTQRLKRWCEGGQYGHIFDNAEDTIRFTHFQTFEFQGMDKQLDVLVPLCFYITQRFDQQVYDPSLTGRLKALVIDEGWRWMLHGELGPYMVDKLKTGRKNNLCNLFTTQSGLDAERAGFGELLNEACPMKMFFANPEIRPETYQRMFGLNVKQAQRVSQLKPREEMAIFATDPLRPSVKQFKTVRLRIDDAEDRLLLSNDPHANQIKYSRRKTA